MKVTRWEGRFLGLLLALMLLGVSGCASVLPQIEAPKVSMESFRPLPGRQGAPRFEVKLRVQNPNSMALDVAGISYTIDLLGAELISGVSRDVPRIEGYSEEMVTLEAGVNLLQMLRLVGSLDKLNKNSVDYRFSAKIDFNGLVPTQRIEESGQFSLLR